MSTKMGPEFFSVVKTYDPTSKEVTSNEVQVNNFLHQKHIPIDESKMSQAEIIEARLENERTSRAIQIQLQIGAGSKRSAEWPDFPHAAEAIEEYMRGRQPAPRPVFADPPLVCPRFREIQDYLFGNRLELALDTMPRLPLPTLYHYILENGGLKINLDELRSFVRICHDAKYVFT